MIFHRFDDIGKYCENTEFLLRKIETLKISYILAIIPNELDEPMVEIIKQLHYATIFQHGYEHINRVKSGWHDEFPDWIPGNEVESKISHGKYILEEKLGIVVNAYVPPWNNTSRGTVAILEKLDYYIYSSQKNNSCLSKMKQLDIDYDVTKEYLPKIKFKDLQKLKEDILDNIELSGSLHGIMYHLNDISIEQAEKIFDFIKCFAPYTVKWDNTYRIT